jgi:epoxyqueuosine reductase QueG
MEPLTMERLHIKAIALRLGADLCGITPVDRLSGAPKGFHPSDILAEARSVIVFAKPMSQTAYQAKSLAPYTLMRNLVLARLDEIAVGMALELEAAGARALPIPSAEPYEFWNTEARQGKGILSLKHAAQCAGLGTLGKNTLLLNPRFGNRLWLGAVLTDLELEPDPVLEPQCLEGCTLCLEACPQGALDGITLIQKRCREHSFLASEGGGWFYNCCRCLQVCPAGVC